MVYDRVLHNRLREGCRAVREQLSWERLAEQMEKYYAEAMDGNTAAKKITFYDEHPFDWISPDASADIRLVVSPALVDLIETLDSRALVLDVGCGPGRVL